MVAKYRRRMSCVAQLRVETMDGAHVQGAVEANHAEICSCGHFTCQWCAMKGLEKCMLCPASGMQQAEDGEIALYSKSELAGSAADIKRKRQSILEGLKMSSKIQCILCVLRMIPVPEKAIVFSQWTSALTIMEHFCKKEGLQTRMVNGSMAQGERAAQLQEFATNAEVLLPFLQGGRERDRERERVQRRIIFWFVCDGLGHLFLTSLHSRGLWNQILGFCVEKLLISTSTKLRMFRCEFCYSPCMQQMWVSTSRAQTMCCSWIYGGIQRLRNKESVEHTGWDKRRMFECTGLLTTRL